MNSVIGLPELLKKFTALGVKGDRIASASVNAVGDLLVADAKERAPAAFGKIRQGLIKQEVTKFQVAIISTAPESPFQEFGTGGRVVVPAEMSDVAVQFQGAQGGGMTAFIDSLVDWIVLRGLTNVYSVATHKVSAKGAIDQNRQLAWAIAKKILRDGLLPQPFLYPAFVEQSPKLMQMLERAFRELMREEQA